jgi:hypothetical protein
VRTPRVVRAWPINERTAWFVVSESEKSDAMLHYMLACLNQDYTYDDFTLNV